MIDNSQFSALQKASSNSFHQQKALIKKVMAGKTVYCSQCGLALSLKLPEHNNDAGVSCAKGCTDIQLDFVL